jgi:hypothetical protein
MTSPSRSGWAGKLGPTVIRDTRYRSGLRKPRKPFPLWAALCMAPGAIWGLYILYTEPAAWIPTLIVVSACGGLAGFVATLIWWIDD